MFYKPCPFKQQKVKRQRSFYMKTIERKRFKRTKMSRQPCLRFIDNCRKDCSMVCFHDFVSCTIPMCPPGWKKQKTKKLSPLNCIMIALPWMIKKRSVLINISCMFCLFVDRRQSYCQKLLTKEWQHISEIITTTEYTTGRYLFCCLNIM